MPAIRVLAALALGVVTPLAVAAEPAFADTPGATAPACVARPVTERGTEAGTVYTVHLRNNCSDNKRVKVVVDWGPDSNCYSLASGQAVDHSFALGSYGKTVIC
ncbi:hypothetical protein [Micromonospora sp. NPDC049175]|uniref:hypothetical protein n=1 Tax=unclassified Micromonospora TaxID=2617518 RepID=UPI0037242194